MTYSSREHAAADPLCRPLSLRQATELTGRTRRTIDRWIADKRLHPVVMDGQRILIEREVVEVDRAMRRAAEANRQRIRDLAGRRFDVPAPDV